MSVISRIASVFKASNPAPATPAVKSQEWFQTGSQNGGYGALDLSGASMAQLWNKWGAATAAIVDIAVYACVSAISETIGNATWRVVDGEGETLGTSADTDTTEPMTKLLLDASRRGDGTSLFYEWAENLYITGENYVYLATDSAGRLCELNVLNSLRTEPYAPSDVTQYYIYTGHARQLNLPLDMVLFDKLRGNLFSESRGYSPVMAAIAANVPQVMQAAGRTMLAYFTNDGMPGSAVSPDSTTHPNGWKDEELNYIRQQMAKNKSAGGKYRTFIFPYPYKAELFQAPDVQKWAELLNAVRPDIYRAYRVSPVVVGDTTSPYQNSDENRINYHSMITSRLKAIATTINTHIMPRLYGHGSGRVFEFELTPFQHIDAQERQAAKDLYTLGVVTGNELRESYGWKPSDLANVRYDPGTQSNTPLSPDGQVAPLEGAPMAGNLETEKADGGIAVMLDVSQSPDLIELQRRVQTMVGDAVAEWTDPASFHITLAYSPTADDAAAEAIAEAVRGLPLPTMELNIGSLASFDSLGRYAVHLRIRRNAALLAYQADLADAMTGAGVALSAFSDPLRYVPHITLGYVTGQAPKATFNSRLTVTPHGVMVKRDDETLYSSADAGQTDEIDAYAQAARNGSVVKRAFVWKSIDPDTGELINRHVLDAAQPDRRGLIADWRKAILARQGVTDYVTKSRDELPIPVRLALKAWREAGVSDRDADKAARALYAVIAGRKALSGQQNRFEVETLRVFKRAQEARSTRAGFETALYNTVIKYHKPVMLEGYADAGLPDYTLTETDTAYLSGLAAQAKTDCARVAAELYADEMLTDNEINGKPPMWWRMSVYPAYNEGLSRGAKDGLGRFEGNDGADSCADCIKMQGRVYRFSEWKKAFNGKLPPSMETACGGFNCNHKVVPYRGYRTVGGIPRLRGYRKSSDSDHLLAMDELEVSS